MEKSEHKDSSVKIGSENKQQAQRQSGRKKNYNYDNRQTGDITYGEIS